MIITATQFTFIEAFRAAGRTDQYSYDGLRLIFDYITQVEEDTGEQIELDVVAICCDYAEASPSDIAADYSIDVSECTDEDHLRDVVLDYLHDTTSVVGVTPAGDIVYQSF